ncbi:hypothetical protein GIY56_17575 [Paracoccus sp. YIM 132242]|uniref:Uncharacterized protein n=1 Tax=Paracoccus lichenicola TaxID=2665644 RepID=A0A6L6HV80_9RHOB|nr:hypothetical protein [Paracoccus lichenicola]MTE02103.1 hypothetical protein [Paracoccus lichenicola]
MEILLTVIAIVVIIYMLGEAAAKAIFWKKHYPAYVRSRASRGKRSSKIHFLLTYGSILDPGDWLEARRRPGFILMSLVSAVLSFSMILALLLVP